MAKKSPTIARPTPPSATKVSNVPQRAFLSGPWIRETTESLVVAFILAFLFRTFDAEAFVIPTGSMAPTLMGAHKDVLCPTCGYRYRAGASGEAEEVAQQRGHPGETNDVVSVTCPMCRYTLNVDPRKAAGREYPTFGGDRILVGKCTYEFARPQRWDVLVFKYPAEAQTNYIKRLVGLPNETVRIWHGDLYIKPPGEDQFQIERRVPAKLRAMAQIVYDNDYVVDAMTKKGWPVRWQPWPAATTDGNGAWTSSDGSRSYSVEPGDDNEHWLRYQHFVPSVEHWQMLNDGSLPEGYKPRASLITDFYAYDTSVSRGQPPKLPYMVGMHWVGDLMLECQLETKKASGIVVLELVKSGRHFHCRLDIASGKAQLEIEGLSDFAPTAQTSVRGLGTHRVMFANVDDQLVLWVNGASVLFDGPTSYEPLGNERPQASETNPGDLAPAGIATRGASVRASHLRLWRDIYYIAAGEGQLTDYSAPRTRVPFMSYDELVAFWSTPAEWSPPGGSNPFDARREVRFPLGDDQFFVLGDNSPMSQDARLWWGERYVDRDLLVGKALLIFWPHSFDKLPGTDIPFPFFPNFARMGFIR